MFRRNRATKRSVSKIESKSTNKEEKADQTHPWRIHIRLPLPSHESLTLENLMCKRKNGEKVNKRCTRERLKKVIRWRWGRQNLAIIPSILISHAIYSSCKKNRQQHNRDIRKKKKAFAKEEAREGRKLSQKKKLKNPPFKQLTSLTLVRQWPRKLRVC